MGRGRACRVFWSAPIGVVSVCLLAAVVMAGAAALIFSNGRSATGAVTGAPAPVRASSSGCSLPAGSQDVSQVQLSPPAIVGSHQVGNMEVPQAPATLGPEHRRGDWFYCYQQSPAGALLAAIRRVGERYRCHRDTGRTASRGPRHAAGARERRAASRPVAGGLPVPQLHAPAGRDRGRLRRVDTTGSYNHYSALRSYEDLLGITRGGQDGQGYLGLPRCQSWRRFGSTCSTNHGISSTGPRPTATVGVLWLAASKGSEARPSTSLVDADPAERFDGGRQPAVPENVGRMSPYRRMCCSWVALTT